MRTQGFVTSFLIRQTPNHAASSVLAKAVKAFLLSASLVLISLWMPIPVAAAAADIATAAEYLKDRDFGVKEKGIDLIAASGHERAQELLQGMLDSRLYYRKKGGELVFAEKDGRIYRIHNALTGEPLGEVKKRKIKRIAINNRLRGHIRTALASLNLLHPDAGKRLQAVTEMLDKPQASTAERLRGLVATERDDDVREAMRIAIALADLESEETDVQLAAVAALDGNVHPSVRNRLTALYGQEIDARLKPAVKQALDNIDIKVQLYGIAETLFFGLSLGSVLVLAAIGLAITFGVMGVINMAHGELIMLGAYTTYLVQQLMPHYIGASLFVAIPAAFLVSALVGIIIERSVIRFLYGRPLESLLATFGVSLILQQLVRTFISPQNVPVANPDWMSGTLEINSVLALTLNRLYIILFCAMVFMALFLILKRTALGLQIRAVSQNRSMAKAMGVRSDRVDALTFGLGSGVAGVAGVALSQLTNVGPNLGQSYIIDSFMVVVFGGVGNLWGTLVGGLSLGVANKILEPWAGAVLAKILVLIFIILFIQKHPRGLFPQKGRAAGD